MNVRIAIPRRADGGWRDGLWAYCRGHWQQHHPEWEVREGHHELGPFNRAAAVNQAATGEWDVLVIADADIICPPGQVTAAVEQAAETGRLVLPFHRRRLLGKGGTRRILRGYHGPWDRLVALEEGRRHFSSVLCVPRCLWDAVRGFDERFEGWGGEDDAFHAACLALAGVDRVPGDVFHLWHPVSPHRDAESPLYKQAVALANRYTRTRHPDAMQRLVSEDRGPDQTVVVCLTNGARPDTLAATLASAEEMLTGPIGRRVIANDSGRPIDFDGWEDAPIGHRSGYTRATAAALQLAAESGQPWIFFLEDDFVLNEPVDLAAMQQIMRDHPELVQLSLKRQAWYEDELQAGGIIEANPGAFTQRDAYVEHRDYWAQNPMLCHRSLLCEHPWPQCAGSERAFAAGLFASDAHATAGILGRVEDAPRCTHIGRERAGTRY